MGTHILFPPKCGTGVRLTIIYEYGNTRNVEREQTTRRKRLLESRKSLHPHSDPVSAKITILFVTQGYRVEVRFSFPQNTCL